MKKHTLTAEPGSQMIVATRVFDAPRETVFRVMNDPQLIPHWWGPGYLTTTVEVFEPREGGRWRFIQRDPQGNEYAFHGVYHELRAPERIVYTFEYEGEPGEVVLDTITLADSGGKTLLTASSVFSSVAARDGMLQEGMESGMAEGWDRLEALLEQARAGETRAS